MALKSHWDDRFIEKDTKKKLKCRRYDILYRFYSEMEFWTKKQDDCIV
jgi:hypothetical protein